MHSHEVLIYLPRAVNERRLSVRRCGVRAKTPLHSTGNQGQLNSEVEWLQHIFPTIHFSSTHQEHHVEHPFDLIIHRTLGFNISDARGPGDL